MGIAKDDVGVVTGDVGVAPGDSGMASPLDLKYFLLRTRNKLQEMGIKWKPFQRSVGVVYLMIFSEASRERE